ncbi:hypothetical protein [Mycoplasma sp. B6400]
MKRKLKIFESFAGIGSQYKALKNIYISRKIKVSPLTVEPFLI